MSGKRNGDGTFRGPRQPSEPRQKTLHARWLEEEVLKRKILGVPTFTAIAEQVAQVGRGEGVPVATLPPGLTFPANYSISPKSCWQAFQRALSRGPKLRAQEMIAIDTIRLEEGILANQRGVRAGKSSALDSLEKLTLAKAKINGYLQPVKLELSGKAGAPIEVKKTTEEETAAFLERLTPQEQLEYLRLFNKGNGTLVETSETKTEGTEDEDEGDESENDN